MRDGRAWNRERSSERPKGAADVRIEERSGAPAEAVHSLIADLRKHMQWAGEMQPKKNFRLVSTEAPEGEARVGTEFRTVGADPSGRFTDASVVTEATRPRAFEFVTEARLETKRGRGVDWTNVHRYELIPDGEGTRVVYSLRIERISELRGPLVAFKGAGAKKPRSQGFGLVREEGLRNLARLADGRAPSARG